MQGTAKTRQKPSEGLQQKGRAAGRICFLEAGLQQQHQQGYQVLTHTHRNLSMQEEGQPLFSWGKGSLQTLLKPSYVRPCGWRWRK